MNTQLSIKKPQYHDIEETLQDYYKASKQCS